MMADYHDNHLDLLRQQSILAKFGELALLSDDLDGVLTEACRLVGQALGTDLAKVVELQADGKTMIVRAGVGWKPGVVGEASIHAGLDTSEGHALLTGEPMISPDVATETRFHYAPFLLENDVRAVANVIIIGGEGKPPFGILQIDSHVPRQFTDGDILFLRSYANLLAAAVSRIRTLAETREVDLRNTTALEARVAERTEALTEANAKLQAEAQERERIEAILRQSQKMEAVGQLTGGLAHDFNNMLAGITGSLELMRLRINQGSMRDISRYIDNARTSADRAAALTHRLLAFSRRQPLDPKPTDLNLLVEGMKDLFSRTVGPAIAVETRCANDLWTILCDPYQLESALLNLVINARDAMPSGGRVVIETGNCVFPGERAGTDAATPHAFTPDKVLAGEYVAVVVTDTGTGMSPDVIARAFDPFFTTKPTGEGTGLGLSMVYGFVIQSGGHVRLSSEAGEGSSASVFLPRYTGGLDALPGAADIDPSSTAAIGATLLLVEDDSGVRLVLTEFLGNLGYHILQAVDAPSALRILQARDRIDLLLTDIGLPGGMNGRQLADAARERRPGLKVLFVTGYAADSVSIGGGMRVDMEVITKPFELDALASTIKQMITRDLPDAVRKQPLPNFR